MSNINGNVPNLKNSKSINQAEIQNIKQNMNSAANQNMILGAELTSNTLNASNISNVSNALSQGNMTNSAHSLSSSTSVGTEELQNVKNEVQKSGNNKG